MYSKLSLLFLILSACSVRAATDCFTQIGVNYTRRADDVHRISIGLDFNRDCPNTTGSLSTCTLSGEGFVTEAATLNITSASTPKILDTVRHTVGNQFNYSVTGYVGGVSITLHANESGYLGWTASMRCFAGTLGDCIGGDVEPGTAIEACTPVIFSGAVSSSDNDGYPLLVGNATLVSADTSNMSTNPAAAKPSGKAVNGAGQMMSVGIGALAVVVAGTVVFGLL